MKIGAHVSIAGGYENSLPKAHDMGATCMQIFSASPRLFGRVTPSEASIEAFLRIRKDMPLDPIYFHASYMINLAAPGFTGKNSIWKLTDELTLARRMGIVGSIVHIGSYKMEDKEAPVPPEKYELLLKNIREILEKTPPETYLILENAGNRKIGWKIDELAHIIKDVDDPRVRVCLDTCHLHAAGYDLSTKETFEKFFHDFDKLIGLKKLEVFQVNDSKDAFCSFRDRHENIGEGHMKLETFRLLVNHELTKNIPFVLETPGFDGKGPDKKNIDILKNLVA